MRFGPRVALHTVVLLLLLAATAVPVAGVQRAAEPGAADSTAALQEDPPIPPDAVNLTVRLQADGDARWTVVTSFTLRDADDRRAFQRLADEFRDGTAESSYDADTFRRASDAASAETGREMDVTGLDRSVTRRAGENVTVGRLETSFTWTNFSRVNESWMVVDDAFNSSEGTWLPGLTADQRLVIIPPRGYSPYDVPIPPQQARYVWEGPTDFDPGELSLTFQFTGRTGPNGPNGGLDLATVGLAAGTGLVLVAVLLGWYLFVRDGRRDGWPVPPTADQPDATDGGSKSGTGGSTAAETGAGAAGAAAVDDDPDDDEAVDVELLSDEERVEYLLQENGGRMKQANIVRETGWSNAKVSQLLSSMDEEDRVDKLRIGRENLISLPDEDVGEIDE